MNKWGRLKNADLILICSSYFTSISTAVQTTNPYVIVDCSRNYLYPFKITGKDYYVTSRCIGGKGYPLDGADSVAAVACIASSAQYLMAVHGNPPVGD